MTLLEGFRGEGKQRWVVTAFWRSARVGIRYHQIDLAVVLPEGYESETADSYPQDQDQTQDPDDIDPFAPIAVLSEV